jgi:hypothetical protein
MDSKAYLEMKEKEKGIPVKKVIGNLKGKVPCR